MYYHILDSVLASSRSEAIRNNVKGRKPKTISELYDDAIHILDNIEILIGIERGPRMTCNREHELKQDVGENYYTDTTPMRPTSTLDADPRLHLQTWRLRVYSINILDLRKSDRRLASEYVAHWRLR